MKKNIRIIIVLLVATFLFGACTRSASKAIVPTPTLNVPEPTQGSVIVAEDLNAKATEAAAEEADAEAEAEAGEAEEDAVEVIEEEPTEVAATETPEPVVEVDETVRPDSYTLQKGEWPICIARRFNLDLGTFFSQNGLAMDSRPAVGTVLKIPADGTWSANYGDIAYHSHPATHVVKAGDTLNTIACYYGDVSPEQIAQKNGLEAPYTITAGQELQIP